LKGESERWVLRRINRFAAITNDACLDVSK